MRSYREFIIAVIHHSTSVEGVDPADYFYRVEIHTLLNGKIFESNNTFRDENDALEYGKLIINIWHAERSITNGTNTQQ